MAITKIYLDSSEKTVIIDNGAASSSVVNVDAFNFDKNDTGEYFILRDSNDGWSLKVIASEAAKENGSLIGSYNTVLSYLLSLIPDGAATEVTLEAVKKNTTGASRIPGIIRPTIAGDVNAEADTLYSVSVANVGTEEGLVLGATIKPGEVLNFSGDALNNYFESFDYDATGTEFLITYIY